MSDLIEELVGSSGESQKKNLRVKQAHDDFGFFCQYYLSDYFFTDAAEYQKILYEVANTQSLGKEVAEALKTFVHEKYQGLLKVSGNLAGAMFIEPREHGKTVRWSFAYVLWCIMTGRKKYALLIGAAGGSAKENLINIKRELEENEELLADFGDLRGTIWRDDRIELANGSCLQAKGAGASMRGTRFRQYRPDLIVLDDVLKDDAVDSPSQRDKIYRWLKKVVFNLGKTAFIIWVNTIFHSDDPISRLIKEVESGTLKRWIAVRLSCLRPDETPLWPEYWSIEALKEKRDQLGFEVFSCEYCNEPLSDEERVIRKEWIDAHRYEQNEMPSPDCRRHFCGVDPATGKHDRTAEISICVDKKTGIIYVLPSWAKTCSETETVSQLMILHRIYRFEEIEWEDVVFSGIYANYIQKLAAEENVYLPIKKQKVGSISKESRIRSISPLIENGIIRFPVKGAEPLIDELLEFPKGRYDDMCDGLYLAVNGISKGSKTVSIHSTGSRTTYSLAQRIIKRVRG